MITEERIKKQRELIEEIGKTYESEGISPIAGRIVGLLMVMDREAFTFDEITMELSISKASASNTLKVLEAKHVVEYFTMPGDRKRYYRIKKQSETSIIDETVSKIERTMSLLTKIIDLKADPNSENSLFFKSMIKVSNHFIDNIENIRKQL